MAGMGNKSADPTKKAEPIYKTHLKQRERAIKINNQRAQGQKVDTAVSFDGGIDGK